MALQIPTLHCNCFLESHQDPDTLNNFGPVLNCQEGGQHYSNAPVPLKTLSNSSISPEQPCHSPMLLLFSLREYKCTLERPVLLPPIKEGQGHQEFCCIEEQQQVITLQEFGYEDRFVYFLQKMDGRCHHPPCFTYNYCNSSANQSGLPIHLSTLAVETY